MTKRLLLSLLLICLYACQSDDETDGSTSEEILNEEVNLRLDHVYSPAVALDLILTNRVQEGDDIGTDNWSLFYNSIEGFEYEHGYRYSLKVEKTVIQNPPADASSLRYNLVEVISKTPGPLDENFELRIQIGYDVGGSQSFVTGTNSDSYRLLNSVRIDCDRLCSDLSAALASGNTVYGTFKRKSNNTYQLFSLRTD